MSIDRIMKNDYIFFFLLIMLAFSNCNEISNTPEDNFCEEDRQAIKAYLLDNKYGVINFDDLSLMDSLNIPIKEILEARTERENFGGAFNDTIFAKTKMNIEDFPNSNGRLEEVEIFRIIKGTLAYGWNKFHVMTLVKVEDEITLQEYNLRFLEDCNLPHVSLNRANNFTSSCFEILQQNKKIGTLNNWESVDNLFKDTGLYNTAYFNESRSLCDGFSYSLDYIVKYNNKVYKRSYRRSCPNELMGIFLVSNELLKLSEL